MGYIWVLILCFDLEYFWIFWFLLFIKIRFLFIVKLFDMKLFWYLSVKKLCFFFDIWIGNLGDNCKWLIVLLECNVVCFELIIFRFGIFEIRFVFLILYCVFMIFLVLCCMFFFNNWYCCLIFVFLVRIVSGGMFFVVVFSRFL